MESVNLTTNSDDRLDMRIRGRYVTKTILLSIVLSSCELNAQHANNNQFAAFILNESIALKKGGYITVYGGSHALLIVNDIISESNAIGAFASSIITNDSIERVKVIDPNSNNKFQSDLLEMLRPTQYLIIIDPLIENPEYVNKGVLTEQVGVARQAEQGFVKNILKKRVRILRITTATSYSARRLNKTFDEYDKMLRQASMIDITTMMPNMKRLMRLLTNGNRIRITTSIGTDFSFAIGGESMVVTDGRITNEETSDPSLRLAEELPSGKIELTIRENSANGTIRLPFVECDYNPIKDVSFSFVNGSIKDFYAKNNEECFSTIMNHSSMINKLGSISFCFNYELKVIEHEGCRFWREGALGTVWITVGNNQRIGGRIPGSSPSFSFPIVGPNIEIDGKIALKSY